MTTPVIMDIIVVVVLVGFALCGARQGLLRSLASLIIVVAAMVGAGIAAGTFSEPAAKLVAPLIEKRITEQVETAVNMQTDTGDHGSLQDLLDLLGLDEEVRDSLAEQIQLSLGDAAAATADAIVSAVVENLIRSMLYGVLYVLSFLSLVILLRVLLKAMELMTKLPVIHGLNALGGGALGLLEGALLLFLAIWVARRFGVSFETEALTEAHILRIFTTNTPLGLLSFLQ